jgi:molybdenum cofactor cytidylyltransferase
MSQDFSLISLLLAAGKSERFGGDKLSASVPQDCGAARTGMRVVDCAYMALQAAGAPIYIASPKSLGWPRRFALPESARGMGASLAALLRKALAEEPDAQGVLVMLADLPYVAPETVAAVAAALKAAHTTGHTIVAPSFEGERGHPIGFARVHFEALLALDGDQGAKALLASSPPHLIEVEDAGCVHDVDTPERLELTLSKLAT